MVVRKRKKVTRQRGGAKHGWGHKKKHRGAGNRGGHGNAGLHKHKLILAKKLGLLNPKKGFFKHNKPQPLKTINLSTLDMRIPDLLKEGLAKKSKGLIIIDFQKLHIDKILGSGRLNHKIKVDIPTSKIAKAKIEKVGGIVS